MAQETRQTIVDHARRFITSGDAHVHLLAEVPAGVPQRIAVLEFPPATTADGQDWIYLTAGMSDLPLPETNGQHRLELVLFSRSREQALVELLGGLAAYPFRHGVHIGAGDTIPGRPGRGIAPGSELTDIVLVKPNFERREAERIDFPDGRHAQVLWVVPITASERQFVKEHGLARLYEMLAVVDVADLQRAPVA